MMVVDDGSAAALAMTGGAGGTGLRPDEGARRDYAGLVETGTTVT